MARKSSKLETYRQKRDFSRTAEPPGESSASPSGRLYVIQKHAAGRLHYDLRLEMDGVLKSWAVPKGPSLDPQEKRLAVLVEDHPLEYGSFEGIIPKGEYGGGTVLLWDRGEWEPQGDPERGFRDGRLTFRLHGEKLRGLWALARMGGKKDPAEKNWLLIKKRDDQARPEAEYDVTAQEEASVLSGRGLEEIARAGDLVWKDGVAVATGPGDSSPPVPVTDLDPSALPGARPAGLPKTFLPQLAEAAGQPPEGEDWLHEIKYDGYRMLCFIDRGKVRFLTRRGQDWTEKFATVATFAATLAVQQAILDGEMVVLEAGGTTDFQALQNLLRRREDKGLVYFVFDLPYLNGYDLTRAPLAERKELLRQFTPPADRNVPLRYSDHLVGRGRQVFQHACRFALEGIVSKHAGSLYQQKRSSRWLKVKCLNRQEFVVGGFTDPGGEREGFGALVLGYFRDDGRLVHAGRVGTGFNEEMLRDLHQILKQLETRDIPFVNPPVGGEARGIHWVRPELVVEVEFTSWTRDGRLRHPSFKGLREDKEAAEVRREETAADELPEGDEPVSDEEAPSARVRAGSTVRVAGVRLSNPERILYPAQGVTKRSLAEYYQQAAELALPHLVDRPLTLFRCPRGREGECFFQKHFAESLPESARTVPVREKDEEQDYVVVDDLPGIIGLVQLGVLEFHPWLSRAEKLERPDRMVFDLDPAPDVAWPQVIEGARIVRDLLGELGLQSFVKTSGGKGLHVMVPLLRRSSWADLKAFSRAVAERISGQWPQKYLATMSKSKRRGRIFIDHFRNSRGATSIAPYSTRARAGATVSTPVAWDELAALPGPDYYTVANLPRRLARLGSDPWEGFFAVRQSLTLEMKKKLEMD